MQFKGQASNHLTPFFLIIIHILFANFIVIISKQAFVSSNIHPLFFLFLRNLLSALILLPIILPVFLQTYKIHKYKASFSRTVPAVMAITIWTYAYSHIPLTHATILTFIIPIITLIFANFLLKEKISTNRVIVILIGLVGVLIAIQPSFNKFNVYYLLVLIATTFWAIANIARKISTQNNIKNFLCYYAFWSVICTFLISIPFWEKIPLKVIPLILVAGILTAIVNVMSFNSYKYNDVSLVQSFDFLRLIIVGTADILLFGGELTANLLIGSGVIVLASIWLILHESRGLQKIANIQI
jgi:S-adenosylmethionine uptake transporter